MNGKPMIKIAHADDHPLIRAGISSIIDMFGGMQVEIEANNGKELIELIQKAKQIPDICLIDISMPVLNGFDTLIELKKNWPDIKVIALTIFDNKNYVARMIMNGANGYILKTSKPEELKTAILSVYNNDFYYSGVVTQQYFHAVQNNEISTLKLTYKEIQVLKFCCSDLSYSQIADKMNTTARSVEGYRDSLFKKLGVKSRASLVIFAIEHGHFLININSTNNQHL